MGLTVVTHVDPRAPRNMERCRDTVSDALPRGAQHRIIECAAESHLDYASARFQALQLDQYVVFVDDDDYISIDSLEICSAAIQSSQAGLAFTNEVIVRPTGQIDRVSHAVSYEEIGVSVQKIHHMAMFRSQAVSERAFRAGVYHCCGIDWAMRAEAALLHDAVHVPIDAYFWVHHEHQHHKSPKVLDAARQNIPKLGLEIRSWSDRTGPVPVWR